MKEDKLKHPGILIRERVIPAGMAVKAAAALLGVGRPALSNLLNGRASLSPEMAARLAHTFGIPETQLMAWQNEYEGVQVGARFNAEESRTYVVPLLEATASDIEAWSDQLSARSRMSVLLRTLVHSTGRGLTKVDFPGNDDSERPGWDGFVEAEEATPWIPSGTSGWEFGTTKEPKRKAEKDLEKSVRAHAVDERANITFVFVTPRRWKAKADWASAATASGGWKAVRVYDASDLEQWLEQSLAGQVWFASETAMPGLGARALDKCWSDWADVATPPLPGLLFDSAIAAHQRSLLSYFSGQPTRPFVVAADSTGEALAFLSLALQDQVLRKFGDRALIIDAPGVLPKLAKGARTFIPIVWMPEIERELGPVGSAMHSVVIRPRNFAMVSPDIVLEPAGYQVLEKALQHVGKTRDEIVRLDRESGRSLTVLRRRLATVPRVRVPCWAEDVDTAKSLVPFLFVGSWSSENPADQVGLSLLSGDREYAELERIVQKLSQIDDAPMWSIGNYRGVVSKKDLLHSIAGVLTKEDLERYFDVAELVLGEDNPALDLGEEQQWAAALYGKRRQFSSSFREGISETLVLLAVLGRELFYERLGIDPEVRARLVVRGLLRPPVTTRLLEANDRDLPLYAEAAPSEFLAILEADLRTEEPAVLGLLRPVQSGVFGHPRRTGLLWALEGLAWSPETVARSALILARLAQVEINDNWVNKPFHSLESIFRAWMPQTAARCDERVSLMRKIADSFPQIAWSICVQQFSNYSGVGNYSHKPRWRTDGFGYGEPFDTYGPVIEFQRQMVEMALGWDQHSLNTLSDLVEQIHHLDESYRAQLWALIESWAKSEATDAEKGAMREKIRASILSRRTARRRKDDDVKSLTERAEKVIALLIPADLLNRHAWLFKKPWIEESADEIEDEEVPDFRKREQRIAELRANALREIYGELGALGVLQVARDGKAAWNVGFLLARDVLGLDDLVQLLRLALAEIVQECAAPQMKDLVGGALLALDDLERRDVVLRAVLVGQTDNDRARLLLNAPFCRGTWNHVDELGPEGRRLYWSERHPGNCFEIDAQSLEGVERLLTAHRPRAAFFYLHFQLEKLDPHLLYRVLDSVARGGEDRPGEYLLEHYYLQKAFETFTSTSVVPMEQKALLEFAYLEGLTSSGDSTQVPNLERYVEEHPDFFVQAIVWAYRRKDDGVDPDGLRCPPGKEQAMAEKGHSLLKALHRIPGCEGVDTEDRKARLNNWVKAVRSSYSGLSRESIGDHCVGEVLSHAPLGSDDVWPCEAVREVLEDLQSEPMTDGVRIAVYNSRGVVTRGEGGAQERELASKYRRWAEALRFTHPYVSTNVLMKIVKN